MAGALEQMLLDVKRARRGERFFLREAVRHYLNTTSRDEVLRQIALLEDKRLFGLLLSSGLRREYQEALLERWRELAS